MKKKFITSFPVLIFLLFSSAFVNGQSYKQCQLISDKGDTTWVYLNFSSDGNLNTYYPSSMVSTGLGTMTPVAGNDTYLLVKTDPNQKKSDKLFIEPYRTIVFGGKTYDKISVKHPSAMGKMLMFLPRIVDGEVSLYRHDYLINGLYPKTRFYLVKERETTDVNKTGFKEEMANYFSEDIELSQLIRSKKLTINEIVQITKKYNTTRAEKITAVNEASK